MTAKICRSLLVGVLLVATAEGAELSPAEVLIAPRRVALGMSLAALKEARPNAFEGPEASRPNDPQQRKWRTMMEVIDLGQPSQASFWYLFSNDKLSGLLKTRNLVLVSPASRNSEASDAYDAFAELLGEPRQETLLRKGDASFVLVRADVWTDDVKRISFYFIATTKEITTAVVSPSDFPMEQVLIRPDPERFEVEDKTAQTVVDLPRSQPLGGDGKLGPSKTLVPSISSQSHQKKARQTTSVNSQKADQPKDEVPSFGLWTLGIVIALGTLWMTWRTISKSHCGRAK